VKSYETLTVSQAVTIASIVIHTDEMLHEPNPNSADFDRNTILSLLQSPELTTWLESFPPELLPQKRHSEQGETS